MSFYNSGFYKIRVLGNVHPDLFDHFDGEIKNVKEKATGAPITTLKIHVRDQAELSGLMNMLYDWRLVLLSVSMNK